MGGDRAVPFCGQGIIARFGEGAPDSGIGGVKRYAEAGPHRQVLWLALVDVDSRGADRIMEEQFSEVALRLGGLVAIGHVPSRGVGAPE